MKKSKLHLISILPALTALSLLANNTYAHLVFTENSASANSQVSLKLKVGHGCEGSPTNKLRVLIPGGVEFISASKKNGWEITTKASGTESKDGSNKISEVTWSGGPLKSDELDYFDMLVRLPNLAGEVLYFKTVQECEEGTLRWIEIPQKDRDIGDYKRPAPTLQLTDPQ